MASLTSLPDVLTLDELAEYLRLPGDVVRKFVAGRLYSRDNKLAKSGGSHGAQSKIGSAVLPQIRHSYSKPARSRMMQTI